VSIGFTNPVQAAPKLPHTKIKALTHSRAFTYRFWRAQALPLIWTRFLRPRNGREEIAIFPGKWPQRCPRRGQPAASPGPCPVRDRIRVPSQAMSVSVANPSPR
jgi:hypothetical protein